MPSATQTFICGGREHLVLSSEHRAAPAAASVYLELVTTDAQTTHPEVIGELRNGSAKLTMDGEQRRLEQRVLDLLGQGATVTRAKLRDSLGVKNERLERKGPSLRSAFTNAARLS
jgi:hypothetical protein